MYRHPLHSHRYICCVCRVTQQHEEPTETPQPTAIPHPLPVCAFHHHDGSRKRKHAHCGRYLKLPFQGLNEKFFNHSAHRFTSIDKP
jgi:hypothetical protein